MDKKVNVFIYEFGRCYYVFVCISLFLLKVWCGDYLLLVYYY